MLLFFFFNLNSINRKVMINISNGFPELSQPINPPPPLFILSYLFVYLSNLLCISMLFEPYSVYHKPKLFILFSINSVLVDLISPPLMFILTIKSQFFCLPHHLIRNLQTFFLLSPISGLPARSRQNMGLNIGLG